MIQIKADGVKYDPRVSSSQWAASAWSLLTNQKPMNWSNSQSEACQCDNSALWQWWSSWRRTFNLEHWPLICLKTYSRWFIKDPGETFPNIQMLAASSVSGSSSATVMDKQENYYASLITWWPFNLFGLLIQFLWICSPFLDMETCDKRVSFQRPELPLIVKISPNMQNITGLWIDIFCTNLCHNNPVRWSLEYYVTNNELITSAWN